MSRLELWRAEPTEVALIVATDPVLKAALNTLRKNGAIGPKIADLEKAGFAVNIQPGPGRPSSGTQHIAPLIYDVFIRSEADNVVALLKFGVAGTNEVNSIAHELGHIYCDYVFDIKKKPLASPTKKVTLAEWKEVLSETMARQFDTATRPPGVIIRGKDVAPIPEATIWSWLFMRGALQD
jgi:hypothetical protein